jgi:O-antigen/teichoic acid export membrane protein
VPVEAYGRFEFALSIALILALGLDAGISGSLAYFVLRRKRPGTASAGSAYVAIVQAVVLVVAAMLLAAGLEDLVLVGVLVALVLGQGLAGAGARVAGKPDSAFLFDSALYSTGLVVLGVYVALRAPPRIEGLALAWAAVAVALMLMHLARARAGGWRRASRRLRPMFAFGRSLLANAFLASALVILGRTLAGALLGDAQAGVFSFYFRLASATLVLHGFLQTMLFRDLYGRPSAEAAKMMVRILGLVTLAAMLVFGVLQAFFHATTLFSAYRPGHHTGLLVLFFATVIAWSATAQQELLLNQERLASRMSVWLALVVAAFVIGAVALDIAGALTLRGLAALHHLALFAYLVAQGYLLHGRGVDIRGSVALVAVAGIVGHAANLVL